MKKVFIKIVVIGIIIHNISGIIGCIQLGQHLHVKRNHVNDRTERGSILVPTYKDNDSSDEARERTSAEVEDFIQNMSVKKKRNLQEPSSIFLRNDMLDPRKVSQTPEFSNVEENEDELESYIRMKAVTDPKEFIKQLLAAHRARNEKRNTDSDDPIAMIVERNSNKARKTRQKKYMCYCQEQECQGKPCRTQGHKADCPWRDKMYPNVKEYVDDAYEKSAEETVGAYSNGYANKIVSAPSTTTEPTKFTIPFANNVNFDQRVIVGGKDPLVKKPKKISQFHQHPRMGMPPIQPHLLYPYNTYMMQQPGLIYHGVPISPKYPPRNRPKITATKSDIPSPFANNFRNVNECIKLYGRNVCVISAASKLPSTTEVETIDLSDDQTYMDEEEPTEKTPAYPAQYVYETSHATTPKEMINEPPVGHRYYIGKNDYDGFRPKLPGYNIENKASSYPNNQYNYQNAQSANDQVAEPIHGETAYLPNYSATKTAENTAFHNQQPIQQSQSNDKDVPRYSAQTVRATTPKLILKGKKNPNPPLHLYSNVQPQNLQNPKMSINQEQSYSLDNNEYVPKYSSKEVTNNRNYDNTVGNSNPIHTYPNNYNHIPHITPPPEVTTPVYSNIQQPKYYEAPNLAVPQPTIVNSAGAQYPHYLYTTDMHMKKSTERTMALHTSIDNFEAATSRPVQAENYYTKNIADQKPTYTYSSGYENAPANSNHDMNINENGANYLATSIVNANTALPTSVNQEYNKYNNDYQDSLTGSSQQYNTGNQNINNNNQYKGVRNEYDYINNNAASHQNQLPNLPHDISNSQENNHLAFNVNKSAYNLGQNISPQNNFNYEPVASSTNINTQVPSLTRSAQQSLVIQPPELYKIENVNDTQDILGKPISMTDIVQVKDGNHPEDILQPVTTLEDVETEDYKSHFKKEKTSTLREANDLISGRTESTKLDRENVSAKHSAYKSKSVKVEAQRIIDKGRIMKHNDTEKLFRGLEQVILDNDGIVDLSQESYGENGESSKKPIYGKAGGLAKENSKQAKQSKNDATLKPTKGSTQSTIQSVDDRPAVSYENTSEGNLPNYNQDFAVTAKNIELMQSTVKKVINNFVPGKAQDLLANYEAGSSSSLVGANAQELLPEILEIPILKNLFSLPEIENMITDTAGNLLTRVTGLPIIGNIPHLIRNTLHSVISQIPRPHPTVAPQTTDQNPTIEEHRFENGQWITDRVPLYETDPNVGASKEIFEKIESILSRSQLEDKIATHPIVQNLIVKAVKHALDKERGVIDESTIRRAFNTLIKTKAQNQSKLVPVPKRISTKGKPLVVQPTATTPMDDDDLYKLAPIVPVTEHAIRGGLWSESQKTLIGKNQKENDIFSEEKRKLLQDKLDQQQQQSIIVSKSKNESVSYSSEEKSSSVFNEEKRKLLQENLDKQQQINKTKSENESVVYKTEHLQKLDAANVKEKSDMSKVVGAKSSITTKEFENETSENMQLPTDNEDRSIERKPIKYFSPNDRILQYIKNHPSTDSPHVTIMAEIVGRTNEDNIETTTRQMKFRSPDIVTTPYTPDPYENSGNTLYVEPSLAQPKKQLDIHKNGNINEPISLMSNKANDEQPSLGNPLNQQIDQVKLLIEPTDAAPIRSKQGTEATRQAYFDLKGSNYLGKLVPLPYRNTPTTGDLTDLQDSNLMYVGDGVRLPLTIRKAPDGSFVLTLSDEVCKKFEHKECPCCLPSGNKGIIVRERRSGEETSEIDSTGEEISATSEESSVNVSRIRRGSEEFRTQPPNTDTEESPEYTKEEEEVKVNKFVTTMANMAQVPEDSRPTALLEALGELVSSKPTTIDFVTQSTSTDPTYQTETYEKDRSKKDTTLWDAYYYDEYQIPTTELPNNGIFGSFIDGLKQATTKYKTGPPYRYQRYAEANFKTNVIKRVLNLMHNLAISAQENKS